MSRKQAPTPRTPPPLTIEISPKQLTRLRAGNNIRISPSAIGTPNGYVFMCLHPNNYNRLKMAYESGRSTKINFSNEELAGSGLRDILGGILDVATPIASAMFPTFSPAIMAGRQGVRAVTGVGCTGTKRLRKGSPEAKARMAEIRACKSNPRYRGIRSMRRGTPEGEGIKEWAQKAGKLAKSAFTTAKKTGLLTKGADYLEKQAIARQPKYSTEINFAREQARKHLGFGINQGTPLFHYGAGLIPAGYSSF